MGDDATPSETRSVTAPSHAAPSQTPTAGTAPAATTPAGAPPDAIGRLDPELLRYAPGPLEGHRVAVAAATDDGPRIELDTSLDGPGDAPVVLLVSGLGSQRVNWPVELTTALHDAGYRTLTVDNRDCGRSTVLPGLVNELPRDAAGYPVAPYGLADMAGDLIAVLDAYDLRRVHVLGMSMGGMIAQHLAFDHAERVASLTSLMSTTGAREVGQAHERARWVLRTPAPLDFEAYLEYSAQCAREIGSPGHHDRARLDARNTVARARGVHPQGTARQLLAIRDDGDRTARLAAVRAPTLVLHGDEDPLIDISGGRATAAAIPGARFVPVTGLGHDLAVGLLAGVLGPLREHLVASP